MRTIERDVAAMIVRSADDHIIMGLKHPEPDCNGPYSNLWVLPGGVKENCESILEAAYRETYEETGLDVSAYDARIVDDKSSDVAELTLRSGERVLYQMKFIDYQVDIDMLAENVPLISSNELVRVSWVQIQSLGNYNLCPPSKALFHKLGYMPLAFTIN